MTNPIWEKPIRLLSQMGNYAVNIFFVNRQRSLFRQTVYTYGMRIVYKASGDKNQ